MVLSIGIARNMDAVEKNSLNGLTFFALPELFNCRYTPEEFEVEVDTNQVVQNVMNLTRKQPDLHFVAGTLPLGGNDPDGRYNRSLVVRDGEIIHSSSKINLFRPINDHKRFRPGEYSGPFDARLEGTVVRVGVVVCFDLRFPEITRRMAAERLDILFVPAHWPATRDVPWRTLLAARAIENQIFTVGINGDGRSYCFSPTGESRYESKGIVDFATFEIDLNEIEEARAFINTTDSIDM